MTRARILTTAALAFTLLAGATGCAQFTEAINPSTGEELIGTSWSGTDSDGDDWGFEFQRGGGVALTFNGDEFDDDSDVWKVQDGAIAIAIAFDTGIARLDGAYTRDATVIELEGSQGDATWTLTIEKEQ